MNKKIVKDGLLLLIARLFVIMQIENKLGVNAKIQIAQSILIILVAILDNLVMPRFFQLYKTNVKKMIEIYEYIAKRALIFGVSFSVVLMYMSKYIIDILYGSEYSDSILILEILMWTVVIRLMAAISGFVITASDNMKVKVKFQFIFAILNIIMNVIGYQDCKLYICNYLYRKRKLRI